ncbi:hypothetical protein WOLCODRAFT_151961 [Wolfiporia cocos MD-104 SS10]|uniref:Uncharacterized protein n=1 Tax=Wolfiporia cocos (strain MD-104) TaxID=742152 RepID=A0A2H3K0H6_WOLCO|nr:hypothetical protein WOLCODRAFT_151961 [Wolfiporia cocos MD-104 SS10]
MVYSFSCAQSLRRMDRFDCGGWLHVALSHQPQEALIRLKHDEQHIAYTDIELPDYWKDYMSQFGICGIARAQDGVAMAD